MIYPLARQNGLVVQEMLDEVLVYDLDSNKAHCLNRSVGFVWKACDGKNSISDIVRQFESAGNGKVTEDFVWLAIDQLSETYLLDGSAVRHFEGMSRRQVLKKIGLASMVALPVISSLMQPRDTLGSVNCACVSDFSCVSMSGCPGRTCNTRGICAPQ